MVKNICSAMPSKPQPLHNVHHALYRIKHNNFLLVLELSTAKLASILGIKKPNV